MSIHTHIEVLYKKHSILEKKINDSFLHHDPDIDINKLKKEKLKIKEEIYLLETGKLANQAA